MAFLPQKLPVTQEGAGSLFPTQHTAPLVVFHGQITVRLQNVGKMLTEQGLGSGADGVPLLSLVNTAVGNPGTLGSEAFHMILFLLQKAFRDQQRHVHIFYALGLKHLVHNMLNVFPNSIAVGTVNEHALNGRIVNELCLGAHIGEPLGKVHFHIGDLLNLFIFCHNISSSRVPNFDTIYYNTNVKACIG